MITRAWIISSGSEYLRKRFINLDTQMEPRQAVAVAIIQ